MAGGGGRENNADAFLLFLFAISLSSLRSPPAPFKKLLMLYAEHPPQGAQVVERLDGRFEFFSGPLTSPPFFFFSLCGLLLEKSENITDGKRKAIETKLGKVAVPQGRVHLESVFLASLS